MSFDIVRGSIHNSAAVTELISILENTSDIEINGTLFLGYPLSASDVSVISIDALLLSENIGVVAFIFSDKTEEQKAKDEQDKLHFQLTNTLTKYESLRVGRNLAFVPIIVSFYCHQNHPEPESEYYFCDSLNLLDELKKLDPLPITAYHSILEAFHRISTMKPKKRRPNISREKSYGGIIKKIEAEIANLDEWQKKAAYEVPDGVQRIRGLAGSGKTIVLALKAAYLHMQHPEWNIAVTFYTRSLSQQYTEMIRKFSLDLIGDEPNQDKLHIMHAWGSNYEPGIYSEISKNRGISPLDYASAKAKYGMRFAFEGACDEVLKIKQIDDENLYDAILIDEAQDFPASFFQMCYQATSNPKRIVFAYDELQSLNSGVLPSISEMFGTDDNGQSLVQIKNQPNEPKRDIVLPVCYRNTPWTLSLGHALGFGIYREEGIIQLFEELELWDDIGYEKVSGDLEYGSEVILGRKKNSYPEYFAELLTPDEAIKFKSFDNAETQYDYVAQMIKKNITVDELDADDILVIFPNAYTSESDYLIFRESLRRYSIESILAGVTTDRDVFRVSGSITCSSIFRAKGNEAPYVYVLNAEMCAEGSNIVRSRNILFTSITRSRAWVGIYGVSPKMEILVKEIEKCILNSFKLHFMIPTREELKRIRSIYRERSPEEISKQRNVQKSIIETIRLIRKNEVDLADFPEAAELKKLLLSKNSEQEIGVNEDEVEQSEF